MKAGGKAQALSPADMARLLSAAGGRQISEAEVRADIAAGAPVDEDGNLSLVAYTAWLVRELVNGAGAG